MDMIIEPVLEIVKFTWFPIGRQIGYIKNLKKNMKELDKHDLFAARDDVLAKINSNKPNEVCNKWLENVKVIEYEVNAIREEYNEDKKCLIGWCPNLYSRMKLGKRIVNITEEMTNLMIKQLTLVGKELHDVENKSLTTTERTLKKILAFIEDVNIRRIGVWGMGGVGKTRTIKLLSNLPQVSQRFEIVLWITVSREGNERKVQNAIAERLKLTVSESDDQLKASIFDSLKGKKFLLFLDDVWKRIDLSDVGIPTLNQIEGCKVVLTTRSLDVCRQMKTNKDVKVETLSEDEAWNLFITSAGDVAMTSDIKQFAVGIVKECGGLPLAIDVVGSLLRDNDDVVVWMNTLRELQLPTTSENEDMEEQVFRCLRKSYDRLPNDCERNLFLHCSLYPEGYNICITELAEYCWLEGYIQGVHSIEEARDEGRHMVMSLFDASLLEKCDEGYVKMRDIIRDFALREASGFLVKAGVNIYHPLEEKEWLQSRKISFMKSNLCNLLERPNCSTLSTLLLQYNDQITIIPDPFFEFMHCLRILDLSGTEIKSLPSSLWNSVNLRGLYLKDCLKLEHLPSEVGALKRLEVLNLGGSTAIRYLPREVGELEGLKRLIVGFKYRNWSQQNDEDTKEWNMKLRVPSRIVSNLPLLEELSLYVYAFDRHPLRHLERRDCIEKEQWDDESMEVVVDELCRLEYLTYLDAYFPKVEHLEHFLCERESLKASLPRRFRFRVGTEAKAGSLVYRQGGEWDRSLVYKGGGLGMRHAAVMETLAHCSFFHLQEHRSARKLSEFGLANMTGLKSCWVIGCDKMETLFDGAEQQETYALLPNLKMLEIENLPELRSLCNGHLLPGSLSKLNYLELNGCNNLKKVLKLNIIGQFCSLKFLSVSNCCTVEEIIEIEEEMPVASDTEITSSDDERVVLPYIQRIRVRNLPELVSICHGFSNLKWPSLESIEIGGCPKLKSLSFLFSHDTNITAPALKEIEGESDWWEALEWEDNDSKQRLQPSYRGFLFGGTFTRIKRLLQNQLSNTSNVRSGHLREFAE